MKNPVIATAKEFASKNGSENLITLDGGLQIKVLPVSSTLIDAVTSKIKYPDVPIARNEDKERDEPNPSDPDYLKAVADADRRRGLAALDALAMFGIELLTPIPEDRTWLKKLKILGVDLSGYDLEDELDIEFIYKRFFVATNDIIAKISEVSGISPAEVEAAESSFPGN